MRILLLNLSDNIVKKSFAIFLIMLVIVNVSFSQRTFYVSSNGSDSNNGLHEATPIKSIAKVNSLVLGPGDKVLFRRGDTFYGGLILLYSGTNDNYIQYDSYSSGKKPVISGAIPVTNWVSIGGNVWQANCQQCANDVTSLYENGNELPLGRYPNLNSSNKGYLTIQAHKGLDQLIAPKETLKNNWVNGEVVIRSAQWIIDRAPIISQKEDTLSLNNSSAYGIPDGWGFFIQKHPATLDQNGEWYYNPSNKVISIYYSGSNPNNKLITASNVGEGFTSYNQSYIKIQNLHITQTNNIGFYAATTNNMAVVNVDITNSGIDGVQINGRGSNIFFENCLIDKANNNGFQIQQYSNFSFKNNKVKRIGLTPGRGKSGDGQYVAFNSYVESNALIESNVLDSIGYTGFALPMINHTVRKNSISNFCMTKSDGAGIYTWNGNKGTMTNIRLENNIVYKAIGAPEGSVFTTYSGANGIYLDDCSQNVVLSNNTVFDCQGIGIFLHATSNVSVISNTSYNNNEGQFVIAHNNNFCLTRNNNINNNVFFSKLATQSVARFESIESDLTQYGLIDNNYYLRPFDDVVKIGAGYKDSNTGGLVNGDISLFDWQGLANKDLNSLESPFQFKEYIINGISSSYISNSSFDTNNDGWYPYSYYGNGRAAWVDGGISPKSLQVDFPTSSGRKGSYVFVYNGVGALTQSKSYVLRFEAVASSSNKSVRVFLRQRNGEYRDLTPRYSVKVGTTKQRYEIGFKSPLSESDAIIMMQIAEDGKVVWLDNITFQEASLSSADVDKYIKFLYNPTGKDSTVAIYDNYVDSKGIAYNTNVTLPSYSSVILLRDTLRSPKPVDVSLSVQTDRQIVKVGDIVNCRLKLTNSIPSSKSVFVQWISRLPSNLQIVNGNGLELSNGTIKGRVINLLIDTTFTFSVKILASGSFELSAEVLSCNLADIDSNPGSGTGDGEDDTFSTIFRTSDFSSNIFSSPNPNQRPLPTPIHNQPQLDLTKSDLSLITVVNNASPFLNNIVSFSITVSNLGGADAQNIQVQNQLPLGLRFLGGNGWSNNGNNLLNVITTLRAGSSTVLVFFAEVTSRGLLSNYTQINSVSTQDPDSTPGNGFSNGEDDQSQVDIRVK